MCCNPVFRLSRMRRQHLTISDPAGRRQRQPRGEVIGSAPAYQVSTVLSYQTQRKVRANTTELGQIIGLIMRPGGVLQN